MKIDLHCHSNYSLDGNKNSNELIDLLKDNNIDIVSITDHDTCEVYRDIDNISDMKLITGLEADAIINNHTYDFLCYNFKLEEVYNYCKEKYETIDKRQIKIFNALVEKCEKNNLILNDIESYNPMKEYAHAAIFRMLDNAFLDKYNITCVSDLYRKSTIDNDFPLYLDMHIVWPDISELCDIIHRNNGKVFLAHPYKYNNDVLKVLEEAKNYIDGIEICNNPLNEDEVNYLYKYAKDNNLLVSCGSDYHGDEEYNECKFLSDEIINDILSWINC